MQERSKFSRETNSIISKGSNYTIKGSKYANVVCHQSKNEKVNRL